MEKIVKEYKIGDSVLDIIKEILYHNSTTPFLGPEPDKSVVITTGIGGMYIVNKDIDELIKTSGLVISANQKEEKEFPMHYQSVVVPFLANIKFLINPELDPVGDNIEDNPYINGLRQSSYKFIIKDSADNIIAELECIGKRPIFKEELLNLIRESNIAKKYDVYPTFLQKYIMNCLKNLE